MEGTFSPTSLENYLACPRKWYLNKFLHIEPREKAASLAFGSAMHYGVGTFYTVKDMMLVQAWELLKDNLKLTEDLFLQQNKNYSPVFFARRAFEVAWKSELTQPDEKRNLQTGLQLIEQYCKAYQHDTSHFPQEYIECPAEILMPNGTTLIMVIDRINVEPNFVTIIDTKTSAMSLSDYFFRKFENSFQLSSYFYACKEVMGTADCIQVDAIKVPYPSKTDGFVRRTFMRTDLQMEEFLNTYLRITDFITSNLDKPEEDRLKAFHQNQTSCDSYGGCKYLPICEHGFDHPAMKNEFTL